MRTYAYMGDGGWKIGPKMRTNKMDGPKQMLWNILCVMV